MSVPIIQLNCLGASPSLYLSIIFYLYLCVFSFSWKGLQNPSKILFLLNRITWSLQSDSDNSSIKVLLPAMRMYLCVLRMPVDFVFAELFVYCVIEFVFFHFTFPILVSTNYRYKCMLWISRIIFDNCFLLMFRWDDWILFYIIYDWFCSLRRVNFNGLLSDDYIN